MIRGEIFKEGQRKVDFDATSWFTQASPKEIVSLGLAGSCGHSAQVIARWLAERGDRKLKRRFVKVLRGEFQCLINWDDVVRWSMDVPWHPPHKLFGLLQDFGLSVGPDTIIGEITEFAVEFLCLTYQLARAPLTPAARELFHRGFSNQYHGEQYCYNLLPDQSVDVCSVRTGLCINLDLEQAVNLAHVYAIKLKDDPEKNFLTFDFSVSKKEDDDGNTRSVIIDGLPVAKCNLAFLLPSFICPKCRTELQMPIALTTGECYCCGQALKVPDSVDEIPDNEEDNPDNLVVAVKVPPTPDDVQPDFINSWTPHPDILDQPPEDIAY